MNRYMRRQLFVLVTLSVLVLIALLHPSTTKRNYVQRDAQPNCADASNQRGIEDNVTQRTSIDQSSEQNCFSEEVAIRNTRRRQHIIDDCAANNRSRHIQLGSQNQKRERLVPSDFKNIFMEDQHKVLYCSVPKVASTNWKKVMLMLTGKMNVSRLEDLNSYAVHHDLQYHHLPRLSRLKPNQIRRRLDTYFKFMFVRHPFERVVSAYENKFVKVYSPFFQLRYGRSIIRRFRSNPTNESLTRGHDVKFKEFIQFLGDETGRNHKLLDAHWQPFSDLCQPCQVRYDVIGKYETLSQDAAHIVDVITKRTMPDDDELRKRLRFPPGPRHTNRTRDVLSRFVGISAELIRHLVDLYAADLQLFNYEYQLHDNGSLSGYQTIFSSC